MPRKEIDEVVVRTAELKDIDSIMHMCSMLAEENGIFRPDDRRVFMELLPLFQQNGGIIGVIGDVGEPLEGMVILKIGSLWYSSDPIVEERVVFVHPKFRKASGGRARRLCQFSKKVSDELGFPLIIGIVSNNRTQSKVKLYESEFGSPAGAFFLYGAKTGQWKRPKNEAAFK